jgi:predicted  nucleic acid-binding Zn-ribbon protein
VKGLEKMVDSLKNQIADHQAKLADAAKNGGYTSSIERELKAFQKSLEAAQKALQKLKDATESDQGR